MPDEPAWKPREIEILRLMAEGLTNTQIGGQLHLAADTVRWYNKTIFEKLEVHNRTEAVRRAAALGLLASAGRPASPAAPPPASAAVPRSPIRYVRAGDVHIACMTFGEGPVDLLFIHGFLSHLELAWEQPEFVRFFEALGRSVRVILFDKRGVGLSDRITGAPSIENTIEDAIAVLDAFGSERAFVMGTSEGGAAAVLLAATHPQRVGGLVLYAATPKVLRTDDDSAWASQPEALQRLIDGMQENWGGAWALEGFAPSRTADEPFRAWWSRILRGASSPAGVRAVLENVGQIDIRRLLPQVRVRTLVIHKTGDRMVAVAAGRYFAEHIPNAGWLELPGDDHIYFVDGAAIIAATLRFVQEPPPRRPAETWIAVVLNVATHEDGPPPGLIQTEINTFLPRHSLLLDQQVIATFESPSRAIRCAQTLRDAQKYGALRVSLHVGECDCESGRPGAAVLAQSEQAAASAAPGEILLTQALRDILAGSPYELAPRRIPPAAASGQAVRLYALTG